jgi:hypothetical protein
MGGSYIRTKRYRKRHPENWLKQKNRYYAKSQDQGVPRRDWTDDEIAAINAKKRPTDSELSTSLRRSVRAIQIKRSKLRKEKSEQ